MARLSFRCGEELVAAVDVARGGVPRERWLRGVVEQALGEQATSVENPAAGDVPVASAVTSAPAEQLSRADAFRRATQKKR